jgi:hypothetical protein
MAAGPDAATGVALVDAAPAARSTAAADVAAGPAGGAVCAACCRRRTLPCWLPCLPPLAAAAGTEPVESSSSAVSTAQQRRSGLATVIGLTACLRSPWLCEQQLGRLAPGSPACRCRLLLGLKLVTAAGQSATADSPMTAGLAVAYSVSHSVQAGSTRAAVLAATQVVRSASM